MAESTREVASGDASESVAATYVHASYIDDVVSMRRGGADYYFLHDDQWNVVALTDASGVVLERVRYGESGQPAFVRTSDGATAAQSFFGNPYAFTGRRWDAATGLYYYRHRYYDPRTGRFTTRDPIGIWGDWLNAGNGYTYTGNNAWSLVDPFGLQQKLPTIWYGFEGDTTIGGFIACQNRLPNAANSAAATCDAVAIYGEAAAKTAHEWAQVLSEPYDYAVNSPVIAKALYNGDYAIAGATFLGVAIPGVSGAVGRRAFKLTGDALKRIEDLAKSRRFQACWLDNLPRSGRTTLRNRAGKKINGIQYDEHGFPVFDTYFDVYLPEHMFTNSDPQHFRYASRELYETLMKDSNLAREAGRFFTLEQVDQLRRGLRPKGFTWHHHQDAGRLQLVKSTDHEASNAYHVGGRALWGGGADCR